MSNQRKKTTGREGKGQQGEREAAIRAPIGDQIPQACLRSKCNEKEEGRLSKKGEERKPPGGGAV